MKKILIIGTGGQVSTNLIALLKNQYEYEFRAVGMEQGLDLAKADTVYSQLKNLNFKPDIIINAAAYTAVDTAEDERDICNNINNISVNEIAKFTTANQSLFVHYSTDYVFDGAGDKPFAEDNTKNLNPLNYYGRTKLDGERAITKSGCDHLIFRTSWVYNDIGKNFVKTILKLACEREELKIVSDQIGSPTYAYDIADITLRAIKTDKIKTGVYHLVPQEQISWHKFAVMIIDTARELGFPVKTTNLLPILSSEFPTKATRPLNSRLETSKLRVNFGLQLPSVQQSLTNCLKRIKAHN